MGGFSSNIMPKNFVNGCLYITWLLMKSYGNTSGKSSLLLALWTNGNFVFVMFKESFFKINHSWYSLFNSLFTVEKRTLMSLFSKNRFVSSANIIVFKKFEALGRSFMYIKNNSDPRIDPCGTPHVPFCWFILLSWVIEMYCFLFVR